MRHARIQRQVPVALAVLVALAGLFAMFALAAGRDAAAQGPGQYVPAAMNHTAGSQAITPKQVAFQNAMRKLWEDHITWTRLADHQPHDRHRPTRPRR